MKKRLIALALVIPILSGCSNVQDELNQETFFNKLFPNPWEALATLIAFIVLLLVVFFFLYKPVKSMLKKRADYVENKIKDAEIREEKSKELLEDASKNLEDSKKQGLEIIEKSKKTALQEKETIINEGKNEAKLQIENAKKEIEQEIEKSKDEIHKEIVDVALSASKEVLKREINDKDEERLIDDFIKDLDKDK